MERAIMTKGVSGGFDSTSYLTAISAKKVT
jgi:7-cyano-7-deazaguanine synthase in queuosine biosynthesis